MGLSLLVPASRRNNCQRSELWLCLHISCLIWLGFATCLTSRAQNPASSPTEASKAQLHGAVVRRAALKDFEKVVVYWTAEAGWRTDLELRNNLSQGSIKVTPILRTFDGAELDLPTVTVRPDRVEKINLQDALANLHQPVGTYGSVILRYTSSNRGNLYAAVLVRRLGHPISFHFDAFPVNPTFGKGSWEGIWWLPQPTADGYLILSNFSPRSAIAHLVLSEDNHTRFEQPLMLGAYQTRRISIREAVVHAGFKATQGGIKVKFSASAGLTYASEVLFDETSEFSALMKMFSRDPSSQPETDTLRAPLVGLSRADAMLDYPTDITLQPLLFLRNASEGRLPVEIHLHWKSQSSIGQLSPKVAALEPEEIRVVDLSRLQGLPPDANWARVELTYMGRPGDLVPVAASYDATSRYGLQSPFSSNLSFMWKGGMWHFDGEHDSLITTGNAGTKGAKVAITLFYGEDGTYRMPDATLRPEQQLWVDVGQLIRTQVPDKYGKTIPSDTMDGSYEIQDLNDQNIGYLYEGKITTDKTYGHATYGCGDCCGYDDSFMLPNPMPLPIGGGDDYTVYGENACSGNDIALGGSFNWLSSLTSVATVGTTGYTSGVGQGSSNISSSIKLRTPGVNNCPLQQYNNTAPAQVCTAPTSETTAVAGTAAGKGFPIGTEFNQAIADARGDSFDNRTVAEQGGAGSSSCYWSGNTIGLQQYPTVSGGVWTVAGNDVTGQHNHWGFDVVGFAGSGAPSYIRTYGPAHGITIPCTVSVPQTMVISCTANTNYNYTSDGLTITVNSAPTVTNCRAGICQTISAP